MARALDRIAEARGALLVDHPFFGVAAHHLAVVPRADVDTMATDGTSLFFNDGFVDKLSQEQLAGVIAHEVMHCVLKHHTRRGDRDQSEWNISGDFAINGILRDAGLELPEGALVDSQYDGMTADEIYARRAKNPEPDEPNESGESGAGGGFFQALWRALTGTGAENDATRAPSMSGQTSDPGGCGEVLDAPESDGQTQETDWSAIATQASYAAKSAGKFPGVLERTVGGLTRSKADWREILRDFIQSSAREDYRWTPPNRRFVGSGLYLPSRHSEALGTIVIAVDTSGSIDAAALERFAAELNAIMDDVPFERAHVVYCDAKVQRVDEYESGQGPIVLRAHGGGGTDFIPVFRWVEDRGIRLACLVYFTDLQCSSYPPEPDYPVLWAATEGGSAPFGQVVRLS